jgi:RHS repeat-associated protein
MEGALKYFARDAFGFSLGYFDGDYSSIGASSFLAGKANSDVLNSRQNLYNGNIGMMVTTITEPITFNGTTPVFNVLPQANSYKYDQLNRITESQSFVNLDDANNLWMNSGNPYDGRYLNQFTYNANGGILTALAKNANGDIIDDQTYHRYNTSGKLLSNRTYAITDNAAQTSGEDLLNQIPFDNVVLSNNNYDFTEIGERKKDVSKHIDEITWTSFGKMKEVKREISSNKYNVKFDYDASGKRVAKHVSSATDNWVRSEFYVRDAQGNLMSTYKHTIENSLMTFHQSEKHIYGSSSLGIDKEKIELISPLSIDTTVTARVLGDRHYNGSNHLGNALVVFTDIKYPVDSDNDNVVDGYLPDVVSANDYMPFGARMAERTFNKNRTVNSFNDKRDDAELDMQDYGMRVYAPMEREFMSVDPLTKEYPELTTYQFASNTPIIAIDLDGEEAKVVVWSSYNGKVQIIKRIHWSEIKNETVGKLGHGTLHMYYDKKNKKVTKVWYEKEGVIEWWTRKGEEEHLESERRALKDHKSTREPDVFEKWLLENTDQDELKKLGDALGNSTGSQNANNVSSGDLTGASPVDKKKKEIDLSTRYYVDWHENESDSATLYYKVGPDTNSMPLKGDQAKSWIENRGAKSSKDNGGQINEAK